MSRCEEWEADAASYLRASLAENVELAGENTILRSEIAALRARVPAKMEGEARDTAEQRARAMLGRMGFERADELSAGDVVELANLIADHDRLLSVLPAGEVNAEQPMEMALCEASRVILRPGLLYRFSVVEGCQACAERASHYSTDPADFLGRHRRVPIVLPAGEARGARLTSDDS